MFFIVFGQHVGVGLEDPEQRGVLRFFLREPPAVLNFDYLRIYAGIKSGLLFDSSPDGLDKNPVAIFYPELSSRIGMDPGCGVRLQPP